MHTCSRNPLHIEVSQVLLSAAFLSVTPQRNQVFLYPTAAHLSSTLSPERSTGCWEDPVTHEETEHKLDRKTIHKEEIESQREQVIWRLKRLLGDTCNEGQMAGETHPPSDSICTEDFVRRFRDEMVEMALPEINMQQLDKEEEAEKTGISDSVTCQSEQKGQIVLNVDGRGTATMAKSSKDTETAHCSQSDKLCQRKELDERLSDSHGVDTSHDSQKAGAGERYNKPQRLADDGCGEYSLYKTLERRGAVTSAEFSLSQHMTRREMSYTCLSICQVVSTNTRQVALYLSSGAKVMWKCTLNHHFGP